MFLMRADKLGGEGGGVELALESSSFVGPREIARADNLKIYIAWKICRGFLHLLIHNYFCNKKKEKWRNCRKGTLHEGI